MPPLEAAQKRRDKVKRELGYSNLHSVQDYLDELNYELEKKVESLNDYIDTYKIEIVEGRNFSRTFPSDLDKAYLINEEAVKRWDFKDPVDKRFSLNRSEGTIIGVYRNQHFGLKHDVVPSMVYLTSKT